MPKTAIRLPDQENLFLQYRWKMGDEAGLIRARAKAQSWLNSFVKCNKHLAQWDLLQLLDQHKGLVRIPGFLPDYVAEEALRIVEGVSHESWLPTEAERDHAANNIKHSFTSTKTGLGPLLRVFTLLLPEQLNVFSAARYSRSDGIEPHDDAAYTPVLTDTGAMISCSRDIAVIYYLTKDWTEAMGGTLQDLETGVKYTPEFNSLVAFRVPRLHEVKAVASDRPRYSIFGWFLQPGKLYELRSAECDASTDRKTTEPSAEKSTGRKATKRKEWNSDGEGARPRCKLARRILAKAAKAKKKQSVSAAPL